jgi:hypothetical protein
MTRGRLRRHWLVVHRWVGLTFGCLLLLAALTGSLLVLAKPLDEVLHPRLFRTEGTASGRLAPLVARLRGEFGPAAAFTLRMPPQPGDALQVVVSGAWNGTIYLDSSCTVCMRSPRSPPVCTRQLTCIVRRSALKKRSSAWGAHQRVTGPSPAAAAVRSARRVN